MQLGMIVLGKVGGNMAHQLTVKGHEVMGYSPTSRTREAFVRETGAIAASSMSELFSRIKHGVTEG